MMQNQNYNPAIHHRRSYRLPGWDYSSSGYYFITVCTHNHQWLFGHIADKKMHLNEYGAFLQNEWDKSFFIRRELLPDAFVIMPNHFHCVVRVVGTSGRTSVHPPDDAVGASVPQKMPRIRPKSVSSFMAGIKSVVTKRINEIRNTPGAPVWHSRFYDHVIRDENELFRIRQYIRNNPVKWEQDKLNGGIGNRVLEDSVPYGDELWML